MEDSFQKIVAILVSVVALFILPVYMTFEKKDDISYSLALKTTNDFVENVREKGYLTAGMYDDYISKLSVTGNSYDIMLEHISKKYYPVIYAYDDEMKNIIQKFDYNLYKEQFENANQIVIEEGENAGTYDHLVLAYDLSEEKYTEDQILECISTPVSGVTIDMGLAEYENMTFQDLPSNPHIYTAENSGFGVYTMSTGDEFNVIIKNKNITPATTIFNAITMGASSQYSTKVYINYGGTIQNELYRAKVVDDDTENYNPEDEEDLDPSLAGQYVESGMVLLLDGEKNAGTTHSNSANIWKDLSGQGNDVTLSGFDFSDTSGWLYNGLKFSGKEYVELKDFDLEEYTIEVVFRLDSLENDSTTKQSILSNLNDGGSGIIYTQMNDLDVTKRGKLGFEVYQETEEEEGKEISGVYSNDLAEESKVYSVSAVIGSDGLGGIKQLFYENGTEYGINLTGMPVKTSLGTKYTLGGSPYAGVSADPEFKGTIYSVRIYNRALTEEEIKENFEVDKTKYEID